LKNAQKLLVGYSEGKRTLGKSTSRWIDNIKIALNRTRCVIINYIKLCRDVMLCPYGLTRVDLKLWGSKVPR
jgi:hypothetical protein